MLFRCIACLVALCFSCAAASGWGAHGHRTITLLALDNLPTDCPSWLISERARRQIAYQSNEPDRWRGVRMAALDHANSPEHYIDLELLKQFGLEFDSLPKLRRNYLRAMAIAKHEHPDRVDAYDASEDPAGKYEWPGFLPYAISEHYAKLVSSMRTARILERIGDPARDKQLRMARANVMYHMGMLSHFVGDAAQPLHTSIHHHGWKGENPEGYTTEYGFHSHIDSEILDVHSLDYEAVRSSVSFDIEVDPEDPWDAVCAEIKRAFEQLEPLYRLERDGELEEDEGRRFIIERLGDGASTLGAFYAAAWRAAAPDDDAVSSFVKYNDFRGGGSAAP